MSNEEIEELKKAARKLQALENAGVDNWEGYDIALEDISRQEAEEQVLIDKLDEIMEVLSEGIWEPSERGAGYAFTDAAMYEAKKIMLGRKS